MDYANFLLDQLFQNARPGIHLSVLLKLASFLSIFHCLILQHQLLTFKELPLARKLYGAFQVESYYKAASKLATYQTSHLAQIVITSSPLHWKHVACTSDQPLKLCPPRESQLVDSACSPDSPSLPVLVKDQTST